MNGSNTSARQHGSHCQGRHWHVDGHTVSPPHPTPLQGVGQPTGHLQQLTGGAGEVEEGEVEEGEVEEGEVEEGEVEEGEERERR